MIDINTQALIWSKAYTDHYVILEGSSKKSCREFADDVLHATIDKFKDEPKVYVKKSELLSKEDMDMPF